MPTRHNQIIKPLGEGLFDRVISILDQARSNVVRAVNSNMVIAYWLIGREIVENIQGGEQRSEYGKQIFEELSNKLNEKYGKGFSVTNLRYFRIFYQAYSKRLVTIHHPLGDEFRTKEISQPMGAELYSSETADPKGSELKIEFSPQLSWSHYRALMRVENSSARDYYESEAVRSGWGKRTLERHIHSQYYERMLQNQQAKPNPELACEETSETLSVSLLKNPYVLEFLELPDVSSLHEIELESAIITQLQSFLLELGKGFAFVGRQKRLQFGDKDLFVDLVFYNCILKCYLLIDLKIGELSYQDVGQMDGYVRMFDDLYTASDDNPTIGLILCAEKNEAVARYSVLSECKHIFASKYMLYLPTVEELQIEIERERILIEAALKNKSSLISFEENPTQD